MPGLSILEIVGLFFIGSCFFAGLCMVVDLLIKQTWSRVSINGRYVLEYMKWCKENKYLTFSEQFRIKKSLNKYKEEEEK